MAALIVLALVASAFAAGDLNITTRSVVPNVLELSTNALHTPDAMPLMFSGGKNGLLAAQFAAGDPSDNRVVLNVRSNVGYQIHAVVTQYLERINNPAPAIKFVAKVGPNQDGSGAIITSPGDAHHPAGGLLGFNHWLSGEITEDIFAAPGSYIGYVAVTVNP